MNIKDEHLEYSKDQEIHDLTDIINSLEDEIEKLEKQLILNGVSRSLPTNREQLSELVDKVYYKQIDEIEFDTVEDSFRLGIEFGIEELMSSENG